MCRTLELIDGRSFKKRKTKVFEKVQIFRID